MVDRENDFTNGIKARRYQNVESRYLLGLLTIGMVNDMYAESRNDDYKYKEIALQEEMD